MTQYMIKQPETKQEFADYYNLRWRILRKPWGEPEGSEKDDIENECVHVIAKAGDTIIGIGRLQFNDNNEAQIRYMAVEPKYEGRGIGRTIVDALEQKACQRGFTHIMLHAREPAIGFYENLGYTVTQRSYLLFNSIQHYRMLKTLDRTER